jgi:murein DD-endopeptidase MepM/ murein hydrolase activator NlpD
VAVGTPVLAAADGTVLRVGSGPLEGKLVIVGHTDNLSTVYYHLSQIGVTPGQALRRGDVIGRSGSTGNATTPHLHFGVCRREDGQCGNRIEAGWADPAAYWSEGTRCFVADRVAAPLRLTYPVPCAKLGRRAAPRDFG